MRSALLYTDCFCEHPRVRVSSVYPQGDPRLPRDPQGTLRVPSGYHQGTIRVPSGFPQGAIRAPSHLIKTSTEACENTCVYVKGIV